MPRKTTRRSSFSKKKKKNTNTVFEMTDLLGIKFALYVKIDIK